MNKYKRIDYGQTWYIIEDGHSIDAVTSSVTFAIDTENIVKLDGEVLPQDEIAKRLASVSMEEKRQRLESVVWAWQVYDELNGFFMTNNFNLFLKYICLIGGKYGWCYNSTFDFAQIDYQILSNSRWKPHTKEQGKAYNKHQPYTYQSLHNDAGARYAYKLWVPYKAKDRHIYCHSLEFRDFMKLIPAGLKKLLNDMDVRDKDGIKIRKLEMNYQNVDQHELSQAEIDYCCNDVKGLYYAVKQFNETIEQQSDNELHIYGDNTNIMTAGGFAKHELLRSMYPQLATKKARLKKYQKQHPLSVAEDAYYRRNYLYRGGICYVNEKYKGQLLTQRKMYRYDVNSEYPYAMANMYDLIGAPQAMAFDAYNAMSEEQRQQYECIYVLEHITGSVKAGYVGLWYDPQRKEYVNYIDEDFKHLIFKFEFEELLHWYDDIEFSINTVIVLKRGDKNYAPFINDNYALKAQAKREHNKTLEQCTKLKLNSSYGKLAERIERGTGHYELNEDTGAVHFVKDSTEVQAASSMNVIIGALCTATARVYILSKIREVCGPNIKDNFIYIDTDSIHCFCNYDKADAYTLGGLKLEAICDACKYIAPKTYVDIERVTKCGYIGYKNGKPQLEIHSKGISIAAINTELAKKSKRLKLSDIDAAINYGAMYCVLCAMNVRGGKVLVPTYKYLARAELAPNYLINKGYINEL